VLGNTFEDTHMTQIAVATLQTPWDCRWSRFASRRGAVQPHTLWMCRYRGSRIPILASDCETCPRFEFQPPLEALREHAAQSPDSTRDAAAI
jgi:hypothetical protein